MDINRYLKHKRIFEVLLWFAFALITLVANLLVAAMDLFRNGNLSQLPENIVWETSSVIVICALLPLIIKFDALVPLRWSTFPQSAVKHLLFGVVFSIVHVAAMVAVRKLVYRLAGSSYVFGNIPFGLLYEYIKDGRTYFLILGFIYLYRFILFRIQGEASVLESDEEGPEDTQPSPVNRLLVKKLGKEFLILTSDIDYIVASGNYVNIHIGERIYPLRSTMAKISQALDPQNFRRVHRSYVVNVNRIHEIQPLESGDATIKLISNREIPVSRTYRAALSA